MQGKYLSPILEYCEPNLLIKREQYYIDSLKPEYNICKIANSSLGYKHSYESKLKMSINRTGIKNHMYGKHLTNETKLKIKTSVIKTLKAKGFFNNYKLGIYNYKNKLIKILDSAKQMSKAYDIPESTLIRYIKTGKLYKDKYYFLRKHKIKVIF